VGFEIRKAGCPNVTEKTYNYAIADFSPPLKPPAMNIFPDEDDGVTSRSPSSGLSTANGISIVVISLVSFAIVLGVVIAIRRWKKRRKNDDTVSDTE
jgi:hypothetical protein